MNTVARQLGRVGVWAPQLRSALWGPPDADGGQAAVRNTATLLEELGYPALWLPGGAGGPLFADLDAVLASTTRVTVATGVLNIWMHSASETAGWFATAERSHPGRVLLGLGVSHGSVIERTGQTYGKPLDAMRAYLDELEAAPQATPREALVLAALGPKMTRLSGERSAGAHPYHVTAGHARRMRQILGDESLLAVELPVVLDEDPDIARAIARSHLRPYLSMPNYTNSWRLSGFATTDLEDGGSDRLVDGLVAWGSVERIEARVQEHLDAGADHVCIQALAPDERGPETTWAALATRLL
ncbi:TIGR03620 family F420-dependent LLM class oxidoreductase [Microbacterium sp. NPDC056044]|uniref:TIGR03620 family F420-dependent LLM class oxidoreductase n=1 Tax=Microbacterium sp. NPDC056044 TaxID=3345690 RepID=UPI0035D63B81